MNKDIDNLEKQVSYNRERAEEMFEALKTILLQLVDALGYEIKSYGKSEVVMKKEDK